MCSHGQYAKGFDFYTCDEGIKNGVMRCAFPGEHPNGLNEHENYHDIYFNDDVDYCSAPAAGSAMVMMDHFITGFGVTYANNEDYFDVQYIEVQTLDIPQPCGGTQMISIDTIPNYFMRNTIGALTVHTISTSTNGFTDTVENCVLVLVKEHELNGDLDINIWMDDLDIMM